ncbi:J domain-containing protein [Sphingomonas sp. URHD0057]|uniref:J domain-containing protein n=1 Tax=Sphingomonas sp. URHD0057 TaxID=1380389 RepID=UPI0018CC102A|nr:J domain-containing protein [Sphingomonas sp. URHD0057]
MFRPKAVSWQRAGSPRTASHYDVLGLGPSADSLQIRAAYVRLLKHSHPDSAPAGTDSRPIEVERVVTAYKILKDDRLRAAYDEELLVGSGQGTHWAQAARTRKRRRTDRNPAPAVALSVLVLAIAALALALLTNGQTSLKADGRKAAGPRPGLHENIPTSASLAPIARLASRLPVEEATALSRGCFAKADKSDAPSAADRCIAFDTAFIYWQQGVGGTYLAEPYFQPQAEAARSERALERLDPDAAMVRAASIRASTFEALLKLVDSNADPASPVGQGVNAAEDARVDGSERADSGVSRFETPAQ